MRFEKLLWEKAVNIKALGRQRELTAPTKWFGLAPYFEQKVMAQHYVTKGFRGLITKVLEPFISWVVWRYPLDVLHQRGLSFEDQRLFSERELRREVLHEYMVRQTCHPYQQLLFRKRRSRYYKVERAVRGFYAQDFVRREAENRLLADTVDLKDEWEHHTQHNFYSDMTPKTRYTAMASRITPLEVFNTYGLLRHEAWDRYFYNEVEYDGYTEQDISEAVNPLRQYNLETAEGRRAFEERINKFIELYPCTIVRKGEKFNFEEFYAKHALVNGKDTSRLNPEIVEKLRAELESIDNQVSTHALPESETAKFGSNSIGKNFPKRMESNRRKVML